MPIYAYRCESCGHAKDVLRKVSDPVLTVCPACGEPTFKKQVTAAGFQLKGSGWYVTDFKGDKPAGKAGDAAAAVDGKADGSAEAPKDAAAAANGSAAKPDAGSAASAAPAAPAASSASGASSSGSSGAGSSASSGSSGSSASSSSGSSGAPPAGGRPS